ncbi:hypothetical protein B0H11DRAFT_1261755 [Mycena galericulata]|nr:hypothetical protein B0H11DRAFT_1261755 [Mycena galericulata]
MNVASLLQDSPSDRRPAKQDPLRWPQQKQQSQQQPPPWPAQQPPYGPPYRDPPYPRPPTAPGSSAPYRGPPPPHYPSPPPGSGPSSGAPGAYSEPSPMYAPMGALRQPPPQPPRDYAPHSPHPSLAWQGPPPPPPPPSQSQPQLQQGSGGQGPGQAQGGGGPGQRTFQGQFHTSFVPVPGRERDRDREASPPRKALSINNTGRRMDAWEAGEWDREREREVGPPTPAPASMSAIRGAPPPLEPPAPPERVFRARRTISIGTFVFPRTPFPYVFPPDADLVVPSAASTGNTTAATATTPPNKSATGADSVDAKPSIDSPNKAAPDSDVIGTKLPDPMPSSSDPVNPADDDADPELLALDTRATILISAAHLPSARTHAHTRIWGGGLPGAGPGLSVRALPLPLSAEGRGHERGLSGEGVRAGHGHERHASGSHRPSNLNPNATLSGFSNEGIGGVGGVGGVGVGVGVGAGAPDPRRLYTDDSHPLGAAVHAGRIRWSHIARARREGRDVRVEVRVVRVLGKGKGGDEHSIWGAGAGKEGRHGEVRGRKEGRGTPLPTKEKESGKDASVKDKEKDASVKESGRENAVGTGGATEAIGRFLGGWGARCTRSWGDLLRVSGPEGAVSDSKEKERDVGTEKEKERDGKREERKDGEPAPATADSANADPDVDFAAVKIKVKVEAQQIEVADASARDVADVEAVGEVDDPADDGRGLLSAGWGAGHDGSAFEVLGVWVGEKNAAHALTRPNRAQRMAEYAARRAVLVAAPSAHPSAVEISTGTGRKRRRPHPPPSPPVSSPNGRALRRIREREEDVDMDVDMEGGAVNESAGDKGWSVRLEAADRGVVEGRTVVCGFGFGVGVGKLGFKYEPAALRGVLFPPLAPPAAAVAAVVAADAGAARDESEAEAEVEAEEGGRARKRRRVSGLEEVIAAAAMEGAVLDVAAPDADLAKEGKEEAMEVDVAVPVESHIGGIDKDADKEKDKDEVVQQSPERIVAAEREPTPTTKSPAKPEPRPKPRDVLLETAEGVYVLARASGEEGAETDSETEPRRWDVWRVEGSGEGTVGQGKDLGERTLLHRALWEADVDFGMGGVRFRVASTGSQSVEMEVEAESKTKTNLDADPEAGWGPRVGVVLWRYA